MAEASLSGETFTGTATERLLREPLRSFCAVSRADGSVTSPRNTIAPVAAFGLATRTGPHQTAPDRPIFGGGDSFGHVLDIYGTWMP